MGRGRDESACCDYFVKESIYLASSLVVLIVMSLSCYISVKNKQKHAHFSPGLLPFT